MATISGRVIFDRDRSLTVSTGDSGIAGIPVVLQNTATGVRLTVFTDANGNYSFINVPNGNYRIVEAYGTPGGVASPGNFAFKYCDGPSNLCEVASLLLNSSKSRAVAIFLSP